MKTTDHVSVGQIDKRKSQPELQIHAAATLVAPGDPFAINPEERKDKAGEIGQFVVVVDSKFMGRLRAYHIDNAFQALKENLMQKLRAHGVMAAGE